MYAVPTHNARRGCRACRGGATIEARAVGALSMHIALVRYHAMPTDVALRVRAAYAVPTHNAPMGYIVTTTHAGQT